MAGNSIQAGGRAATLALGGLNPKQKAFCQSRSRYTAYGGARGGGKTHIARIKAIMGAVQYPGIRILMVRREYPELEQTVIIPMRKLIPKSVADYNGTMHMFSFLNGSIIKFGHYGAKDELEYQGQEYDWIFMDEATQFTEDQFLVLCACLRGANDFPKRMYLTCNPGGVGHFWVKRLFVDRDFRDSEAPEEYTFIKATVRDNPKIEKEYIRQLEHQPAERRAAWLDGDWDAMSGVFFPEVSRRTHVIPDLWRIPAEWRKYRAFDYGLDCFACLWIAVDCDGRGYVYRQVSRENLIVSEAAALMLDLTPAGEQISATLAPPDMWNRQKDSGKSMAQLFMENGVGIIAASNSRIQGWMALKEALKPLKNPEDRPGLLICESCRDLYNHLSTIQHDEKNPEDCATEPHSLTHDTDALRYFAVTRLLPAERAAVPEPPELGQERVTGYDEAMTGGDMNEGYLNYG